MQRTFTILGVLALFAFGAYAVAFGFAAPGSSYEIPKDQTLAAVLVGSIVAVVVLTVLTGGGLAFASTFITKELTKDQPGAPSNPKADSSVTPYVPSYSYQATPEKVEARQWLIGSAVGLVTLAAIIWSRIGLAELGEWIQAVGQTQLLIGAGSIVGIAAATVAVGAGLAFWFHRTQEEKEKAVTAGPMWPSAQIAMLEAKLSSPRDLIPKWTFMDTVLIATNVLLALVILGIIVVWVMPGIAQVIAVDAARFPTAAPAASAAELTAAPVPAAAGPSAELQKDFAALPAGNADAGENAYPSLVCASCHSLATDQVIVGPSLAGVGARAATRKPGYSAELYIYESITHPGAYVVSGFNDGVMPVNLKDTLTAQQIADAVAYLGTLK
ncbi:MAG: c-type cytochrome [Chloroflexota bacterium]